jgi:hypothetical protein
VLHHRQFKTFTQNTPQIEKPKNGKNSLPFFEVANPTRENKPIAFSRSNKSGQQLAK